MAMIMIGGDPVLHVAEGEDRSRVAANRVDILDVPLNVISLASAVERIGDWITRKESRYVCVADVNSVMTTRTNPVHKATLLNADMVTPDGMPLVWMSRMRGHATASRVSGTDLVRAVCEQSARQPWRHFFYGGAEGVPQSVAAALQASYPGLTVVGMVSPPFHALSDEEDAAILQDIRNAKPDIVWIGLGCPKQELWMTNHVDRLPGVTLIGVGAAFDFLSGRVKRAPLWMQRSGLEWLSRLVAEPRRLWRRYLVVAPRFIALAGVELLCRSFWPPEPRRA